MKSTLFVNSIPVEVFVFPGGEVNIRLSDSFYDSGLIHIEAKIQDSDGIMALILIKNAIDQKVGCTTIINLLLKYFPYARQDRVCNPGEALSVKVFASLINDLNFNRVTILDPHSDVTPSLINKCTVIPQDLIMKDLDCLNERLVVAPDLGATKKVEKLGVPYIQGFKNRDPHTGNLSGFSFTGDVKGKDLLIIDDICDGGGTFLGLAKELYEGGANSIDLFVTHGIFSKGLDELTKVFGTIYTTDSIDQTPHPQLEII